MLKEREEITYLGEIREFCPDLGDGFLETEGRTEEDPIGRSQRLDRFGGKVAPFQSSEIEAMETRPVPLGEDIGGDVLAYR